MPIWRLEPINLEDFPWGASTYTGSVIVRAADEDKARDLAASEYRIGVINPPLTEIPKPPWLYPWLTVCTRIEDSVYEEDGPDTILGPEEASSRSH